MSTHFRLVSDHSLLRDGLKIFQEALPQHFSSTGKLVTFEEGFSGDGFSIDSGDEGLRVRFSQLADAYRALGIILSGGVEEGASFSQTRAFSDVGIMWDVSRNAVLKVEAVEELFRALALMGYTSVQLYMEDTYEIPGEDFFGYGRGAYTEEELRRIDAYGHTLGIEVIPCIQTLGHLEQMLQWPSYHKLQDVKGVLLVGEDAVYTLIGKMLDTLARCFRSRRIHIGMDEAHGVGTGEYLKKHGLRRPFDILNEHLRKVTDLCKARGLRPMMWSDMYFRLGSDTHDYYDFEAVIPQEVTEAVSPDVDLVYWDYYHADAKFYEEWIRRHRMMGKEPIFSGGAWSWGRFWAHWGRWRETIAVSMQVAREQKVREAFLTVWGDDGMEVHPFSVLPAAQYFAEWAYVKAPEDAALECQFAVFSEGVTLADCRLASELDEVPLAEAKSVGDANFSKWILWHDPLLGFLDRHILPHLPEHYRTLAQKLEARGGAEEGPLRLPWLVARAVAAKAKLHLHVRSACEKGDIVQVRAMVDHGIPKTLEAVRALHDEHRKVWQHWNKPFGWEVLEHRYGGVVARLESLRLVLEEYLKNPSQPVPEFAFQQQLVVPETYPEHFYFSYLRAATPGVNGRW